MMYVRARGLRRRGVRLLLAIAVQPVLPSTRRMVSALQINSLSTLDSLPARPATDASPMPSRTPAHGSRWIVERLLLLSRGLSPPIICQLAWLFPTPEQAQRNSAPAAKHAARSADTAAAPKTDPGAGHHAASTPESQPAVVRRAASTTRTRRSPPAPLPHRRGRFGRRCNSTHLIEIDHIVPHGRAAAPILGTSDCVAPITATGTRRAGHRVSLHRATLRRDR